MANLMQIVRNRAVRPIAAIFIAAGRMDADSKIKSLANQIGIGIHVADGGFIHCDRLGIVPSTLIGDMDSIKPGLLEKPEYQGVQVTRLDRAKDKTDLEAALDLYKCDDLGRAVIFGALGGELDHSLYNLFLLARNPVNLTMETQEETVFAVNPEQCPLEINPGDNQFMTVVPFYESSGIAKIQSFESGLQEVNLDSAASYTQPIGLIGSTSITVTSGVAMCILSSKQEGGEWTRFLPMLLDSAQHKSCAFEHETGRIHIIKEGASLQIDSDIGRVVSMFPILGAASGIKTRGFKWELGEDYSELNLGFLSISNVLKEALGSVYVSKGSVVLFESQKRDEQMLKLKDKSSTAVLTKEKNAKAV